MYRNSSNPRSNSSVDKDVQRVLNLTSSPGSSRKHSHEKNEGVHIPNFSKEVSSDFEDETIKPTIEINVAPKSLHLIKPIVPKSILKRRNQNHQHTGVTETQSTTKCCHTLVNKVRHIADITLQKLERSETKKSSLPEVQQNEYFQEIKLLKSSPGALRRHKLGASRLADPVTKTQVKNKNHIYEDIEEKKVEIEKFKNDCFIIDNCNESQDFCPSLVSTLFQYDDHNIEKIHNENDNKINRNEANFNDILQNETDLNITITEIIHADSEPKNDESNILQKMSPVFSSLEIDPNEVEFENNEVSKSSSDHEYEIIEKPSPILVNQQISAIQKLGYEHDHKNITTDEELIQNYSLQSSDEFGSTDYKFKLNNDVNEPSPNVESIQDYNIDQDFTPDVDTETDHKEGPNKIVTVYSKHDKKLQHRFKEGTEKIKTQAKKLKTKLDTLKLKKEYMPEKVQINCSKPAWFSISERPKFLVPIRKKKIINRTPKNDVPENKTIGLDYNSKKRSKYNIANFSKLVTPRTKSYFSNKGKNKNNSIKSAQSDSISIDKGIGADEIEITSDFSQTSFLSALKKDNEPFREFSTTRPRKKKKIPLFTDTCQKERDYEGVSIKNDCDTEEEKQMDADEMSYLKKLNKSKMSYFNDNLNTTSMALNESKMTSAKNNEELFVGSSEISHEKIRVREYSNDDIVQEFDIARNTVKSLNNNSDKDIKVIDNDFLRYSSSQDDINHDGYYTFPPVRPSRFKQKTKFQKPPKYTNESENTYEQFTEADIDLTSDQYVNQESIRFIDESVNSSNQFSETNIDITEDQDVNEESIQYIDESMKYSKELDEVYNKDLIADTNILLGSSNNQFTSLTDLPDSHEYANDIITQYLDNCAIQHQTQPIPPKRYKKKDIKVSDDSMHSGSKILTSSELWKPHKQIKDIIVYQKQYDSVNPQTRTIVTDQRLVPPPRSRSLSLRGTSFCDVKETSHSTKPLIKYTDLLKTGSFEKEREMGRNNSEYATVNKRYKHETPSVRYSKRSSSERKYYDYPKESVPSRPEKETSSRSLTTFDVFTDRSIVTDAENNKAELVNEQQSFNCGEILSKMKNRPLPPPPRPPRGPKKMEKTKDIDKYESEVKYDNTIVFDSCNYNLQKEIKNDNVVEVEVATQTDPLPDNVNVELIMNKTEVTESGCSSRPISVQSFEFSDYCNLERTPPSVILIERNVSSPTKINEQDLMLTEASLIVQHIDINEPQIPNKPLLSKANIVSSTLKNVLSSNDDKDLDIIKTDTSKEIKIDNLVAQRLQVKDLDVSHLSVSELQAGKLKVSQLKEVGCASEKISESGIELSQSVIDEIVRKFSELTSRRPTDQVPDANNTLHKEEEISKDYSVIETNIKELLLEINESDVLSPLQSELPNIQNQTRISMLPQSLQSQRSPNADFSTLRIPIPPKLTQQSHSYFQGTSLLPASFYATRALREEQQTVDQSPFPTQRVSRQSAAPHGEYSSDEGRLYNLPNSPNLRAHELTIIEAGAQFISVCQKSISNTFRNIFNYCIAYVNATEDKKDMQMALVIFLVLIAGLVMFGLSDSRTVHHHHWDFINPPDGIQ